MNYLRIKGEKDMTAVAAILVTNGYRVWIGRVLKGGKATKVLYYEEQGKET